MATDIELIQFPYSHYNEKARWALDLKGVDHRRTNLLPGPHAPIVKRLTGATLVPVLRIEGQTIAGSGRIIDELEGRYPEPALYPVDASERERALDLARWFDDEVGPLVRRGVFASLLDEPSYVCSMFAGYRSLPVRVFYRATFPVGRRMMKQAMQITGDAAVREACGATERALGFVADQASTKGYLVGDNFTVADLTAAALLAPAVNPEDSPMALPEPRPARLREWHDRWAAHPGAAWVREQYRRHRGGGASDGGRLPLATSRQARAAA